jgi:hypothetical protein
MCGGENKKHRRVGTNNHRDRFTRSSFEIWSACWSQVKISVSFYVYSRLFGCCGICKACRQRPNIAAVRDCGLRTWPPTPKFERGRMLGLPLKPLLQLYFVTMCFNIFFHLSSFGIPRDNIHAKSSFIPSFFIS